MMNMKAHHILLTAIIALGFAACGPTEEENHDNHDHGENHANHENHDHGENHANHGEGEEHACEHFEGGPNASVTATAEADGAPESFEEHHLIQVTLAEGDTSFLQFSPDEAGDFTFWLSADVPLKLSKDGTEVAGTAGEAAKGCEEDAVTSLKFEELEAATYTIEIGPTDATELNFVAEHGHHEEGEANHDHGEE